MKEISDAEQVRIPLPFTLPPHKIPDAKTLLGLCRNRRLSWYHRRGKTSLVAHGIPIPHRFTSPRLTLPLGRRRRRSNRYRGHRRITRLPRGASSLPISIILPHPKTGRPQVLVPRTSPLYASHPRRSTPQRPSHVQQRAYYIH